MKKNSAKTLPPPHDHTKFREEIKAYLERRESDERLAEVPLVDYLMRYLYHRSPDTWERVYLVTRPPATTDATAQSLALVGKEIYEMFPRLPLHPNTSKALFRPGKRTERFWFESEFAPRTEMPIAWRCLLPYDVMVAEFGDAPEILERLLATQTTEWTARINARIDQPIPTRGIWCTDREVWDEPTPDDSVTPNE